MFRTSHDNVSINETSSYVDLAPLYGNDEKTLNDIRVHDGRGMILPDTFAEDRLLLLPPAVCVLLVLFNRNHNVGIRSSILVASSLNCCFSTSPTNCFKLMNAKLIRNPKISLWKTPSVLRRYLIRTKTFSRPRDSLTVVGLRLSSFPITSVAFSAWFAKAAGGVWILSRCVVPYVLTLQLEGVH